MLCDKCKKRQAIIYYTEIINGIKKEQHLCEECAAKYADFELGLSKANKELSLGGLLSSILGNYSASNPTVKEDELEAVIQCERCGMTYDAFLQGGKFGCAECYTSFGKQLEKSFRQIHGATSHIGKRPKGFVSQTDKIINDLSEIDRLSIRLQDAIEKEEFDQAVCLRDQIRALKAKEESHNV
ncbi:MAG: UvrB/UvrC motif-containing protein [bacterium]|nr:UvrB/UvrC motif-containing protein [bacterium]